eukprot:2376338-Pleurochrysis_carterae.AAC.2
MGYAAPSDGRVTWGSEAPVPVARGGGSRQRVEMVGAGSAENRCVAARPQGGEGHKGGKALTPLLADGAWSFDGARSSGAGLGGVDEGVKSWRRRSGGAKCMSMSGCARG